MSAQPSAFLNAINPNVSQSVAFTGTSAQSTAFQGATSVIQIVATAACFVAIGASPTAAANTSMYVPANVPVMIGVVGGQKLAVIQATGTGTLYITEGA